MLVEENVELVRTVNAVGGYRRKGIGLFGGVDSLFEEFHKGKYC